VILVCFVL